MIYQGTIQNGVVVFENDVNLPEGSPVRVELVQELPVDECGLAEDDPLLNMSKLAVDMGIPDLAGNVDHYLYGHPKAIKGN
jgi:hypothetical protein